MADELQQLAQTTLWRRQVAARIGGGTLNVSATTGFLTVPTMPGTPLGTPTVGNGAMVIDTVNNRLYFWSTNAWRNAGP